MKCYICDKEATGRYSPDLDVGGVGYCEEHKADIQFAYYLLIYEGEKEFDSYIEHLKSKNK